MRRAEIVDMLRAERDELSEFLGTLGPEDWAAPSLCDDWTVLEVTAHLASAVGLSRRGLVGRALRYGTGTDGANARSAAAYASRGTPALIEALADPGRLGLGFFQPAWGLCEAVVHHQDIRRALDRPRPVPVERLEVCIDVLWRMPFLTGRTRPQRRISVIPTDLDRRWGDGPSLEGPAEALLMVLAGRVDALPEVSGEAVALFEPAGSGG